MLRLGGGEGGRGARLPGAGGLPREQAQRRRLVRREEGAGPGGREQHDGEKRHLCYESGQQTVGQENE